MTPPTLPRLALLALFGGVVGSFFDGFHTHSGTTLYARPVVLEMAWWTPALFASAALGLGFAYDLFTRSVPPPPTARVVGAFAAFGALYFASGYLPAGNLAKLGLLLLGTVLLARFADASRAALLVGLVASVVGPLTEVTLVHAGVFSHLQPDVAGIPLWLPGLYLASGPGAGAAAFLLLRGRPAVSASEA